MYDKIMDKLRLIDDDTHAYNWGELIVIINNNEFDKLLLEMRNLMQVNFNSPASINGVMVISSREIKEDEILVATTDFISL